MDNCGIHLFEFTDDQHVLFLGEGNFSFSSSLLAHLKKKYNYESFNNVYVTCYESELSSTELLNVKFLKSIGNVSFYFIAPLVIHTHY